MKLRVYLSSNYVLKEIPAIRTENPSYSVLEATRHFIEYKYGSWIDANMPNALGEYTIEAESTDFFDLDFTYADDAEAFRESVGGNYL